MRRRPRTRGDCEQEPRPCPWTGCRYHLGCEVRGEGCGETCALDLAAWGGLTQGEVGFVLGVSKQRVEQIERAALVKMCVRLQAMGLDRGDLPVEAEGWTEPRDLELS